MSVIIRLQNLPWSANALDIRQYFRGLSIPEGGVHIVGGEQGDAFIAFSTDEDARQAMLADGGKIKEIKIKLLLSSRAEMQKVIELARQQSVGMASYIPLSIISGQNTNSTSNQALPVNANTTGPIVSGTSSPHDPSSLTEKKDNDSISNSSGRDRRKRSRSRDRKERHRDRDRDRDRDRERRRRERSRSRDRSRRGRRERTRSRDRSKSRDKEHQITNRDRERRNSREAKKQDSKENGSSNINNTTNWNMNNGPNLQPSSNNNGFNQPPQQSIMPQSSSIVQGSNLPSQMMGSIGRGRGMPLSGSNVPPPLPPIGGPGSLNETINQNQFMRNGPWSNRGGGHSSEMGRGSGFTPRNGVFGMLGQDGPPEMDQGGGMRGNFRSNFRGRGGFGPGPRGPMMDNDNFNDRRGGGPYRGDRDMDGSFPGRDRFEQFPNRNMNNQYSGFRGENRYSDLGYDPRNPNPGTCIKISNMPPEASYSDVRRFFHGHFIANNGLKLINDNFGKRTGVAYVRFGRPEAKEVALKMGGKPVRGCPVEILHIDDEVFDKAIDSFRPANPCDSDPEPERENIDLDTDCVVLTEIPSFTKELDVFKIFNELNILEILMTHNPNKQFVAYIRFHSKDEAKIALNKNSNLMIAHKQVKIAPLNLDKFLDAKKIKDEIVDKNEIIDLENINSSDLSQIQSECVLLQKLPLQVNERDIRDFFSDIGLVPARIHILSLENKSFAEAFCEFSNLDEGKQALSKNNLPLGKQEVAVKSISRGDMMEALGMPIQNAPDMPGNGGFGLRGPMGRGGFMNNRGGGNIMQPRMPMMGRFGNQTMGNDGPPIEGFGQPGCVVALDNIPFRSEIEEILQFFHNFDVTRDQIIRRFNDKGWATGEARVALSSPQEVDRALHELRGEKMRGRPIFLTRV